MSWVRRSYVDLGSSGIVESRVLEAVQEKARGEVDVRYVGRLVKRAMPWHQKRNRPLKIGGSIGHHRVTAGTLGCFVKRRRDGVILILSNNHVLADENRAKVGDSILQPGTYDGGRRPSDIIGTLVAFAKVKTRGVNLVDCAVASVHERMKFDVAKLTGLGKLAGVSDTDVDEGDRVAKVGRTTGVTQGHVTAFEVDNVVVEFDAGDIRFDDQIEIEGGWPGLLQRRRGQRLAHRGRRSPRGGLAVCRDRRGRRATVLHLREPDPDGPEEAQDRLGILS